MGKNFVNESRISRWGNYGLLGCINLWVLRDANKSPADETRHAKCRLVTVPSRWKPYSHLHGPKPREATFQQLDNCDLTLFRGCQHNNPYWESLLNGHVFRLICVRCQNRCSIGNYLHLLRCLVFFFSFETDRQVSDSNKVMAVFFNSVSKFSIF
jgi:hypothetical protein